MNSKNNATHHAIKNMLEQDKKMTPKHMQIVEAAIELIAEKGYSATSTSEIAKRAGVAEGTIFRHYRTKKELLISIVNPVIAQFFAPIFAENFVEEVFRESYSGMENFLFHFIQNRFAFIQANVPLIKIMLQESAFHPEIQGAYKKVFLEKVYPEINQTLDFFKAKGEIREIDNETIIRMMAPTIIGFLMTRFLIQPDKVWDDEKAIKQTIEYIMQGLSNRK